MMSYPQQQQQQATATTSQQPPIPGQPQQQQQQQQQQQHAPMGGYQQYQSSGGTGEGGLVSYPTAHLYQGNTTSAESYEQENSYWFGGAPPVASQPISDPVTKAVVDNILGKLPTKKSQLVYRCDVCDQEFSGPSVLDTHLAGAKHAKKLKSIEILSQLTASGQNFSKSGPGGNLRCEACGIDANSSQQLQTHLAGNKHKQRMQKLGGKMPPPASPPVSASILMPPPPAPGARPGDPAVAAVAAAVGGGGAAPAASGAAGVGAGGAGGTPPAAAQESKTFYCSSCNCTLNSSIQMQQHMESKKHKERASGNFTPSNKHQHHHPYRRSPQTRFSGSGKKKKNKQPLAFLTPLTSSFVHGDML